MTDYIYPATLEPDTDGRLVVHFPSLPEALTDGADQAEALREAADCLSEALASRIVDGEEIPAPGQLAAGQHLVSPSPTVALKAALYEALRRRDMTVADLAARLDIDWHQAARLIDPRRTSKLTSLSAALHVLGCEIRLSVSDPTEQGEGSTEALADATLKAVEEHPEGVTTNALLAFLSHEVGLSVRPNRVTIALKRHLREGRLDNRDDRWYPPDKGRTRGRRGGTRTKKD